MDQLIDANLDRAREGLRVIEEWCRFGLDRVDLVKELKNCRQLLGSHHLRKYKKSRSTETDQGLGLTHPSQKNRKESLQIVEANCARVQEALRVLEEFCRNSDEALAQTASQIRYRLYDLEVIILSESLKRQIHSKLFSSNLCLITSASPNLIEIAKGSLQAGLPMIQYRDKESTDAQRFHLAKELASLCRKHEALFIINDRIDLALAVEADGVHLGQEDLPTDIARNLLGTQSIVGRSTNCLRQLEIAESENCDYVGLGPINSTKTKPELKAIGVQYVQEASLASHLPCFAIGGINLSKIAELKQAGANRIAVSEAIMKAKDPSLATSKLLDAIQ